MYDRAPDQVFKISLWDFPQMHRLPCPAQCCAVPCFVSCTLTLVGPYFRNQPISNQIDKMQSTTQRSTAQGRAGRCICEKSSMVYFGFASSSSRTAAPPLAAGSDIRPFAVGGWVFEGSRLDSSISSLSQS